MIRGHDLNNIRYVNDSVLIENTEGEIQERLQKIINEKKVLIINWKKIEGTFASKMNIPICELLQTPKKIKYNNLVF